MSWLSAGTWVRGSCPPTPSSFCQPYLSITSHGGAQTPGTPGSGCSATHLDADLYRRPSARSCIRLRPKCEPAGGGCLLPGVAGVGIPTKLVLVCRRRWAVQAAGHHGGLTMICPAWLILAQHALDARRRSAAGSTHLAWFVGGMMLAVKLRRWACAVMHSPYQVGGHLPLHRLHLIARAHDVAHKALAELVKTGLLAPRIAVLAVAPLALGDQGWCPVAGHGRWCFRDLLRSSDPSGDLWRSPWWTCSGIGFTPVRWQPLSRDAGADDPIGVVVAPFHSGPGVTGLPSGAEAGVTIGIDEPAITLVRHFVTVRNISSDGPPSGRAFRRWRIVGTQ